jgi:hypothetical protein
LSSMAKRRSPHRKVSSNPLNKPAKMKQLHTIAAVLLLFPNSGLTQVHMYETSLNIQAKDLATSPDGFLNMRTAAIFIDNICGQAPKEAPAGFVVSGAYNMHTGDFMTWNQYIYTMGQLGNPQFYWAIGPWHTFTGTCSLKPASFWAENSYRSEGRWVWNAASARGSRVSRVDIRLPGFSAETLTDSWRSRCENVDLMADTFRAMPELSEHIKKIWKGLNLRVESTYTYRKPIQVPYGHKAMVVATTKVLVVHAQLVLNVQRWYWYYEPEMSGIAVGWQGMGGLWNYVYAELAWVNARGLVQQEPEDPRRLNTPEWWYCVNMGPSNIIMVPLQPGDVN